MAEARSRREPPPRMRPRTTTDDNGVDQPEDDRPTTLAEQALHQADAARAAGDRNGGGEPNSPARQREQDEEDFKGFDAEINNRYEEIKRGSTHISELQQMTMPQLLKIAKEENLTDYTGLKKQDLIFRIL